MRVIARGSDDRPLDRIAVGEDESLIYVVAAESAGDDDPEPVGFPKDRIFEYHADLLEKLNSAWDGQDHGHIRDEWSRAPQPLNSALKDLRDKVGDGPDRSGRQPGPDRPRALPPWLRIGDELRRGR